MNGETDHPTPNCCPACRHGACLLGRLGNKIHRRCRGCGLDFHHEVPDDKEVDLEDLYTDIGGEG